MAEQSTLAKLGVRTGKTGSSASLAYAFALADGNYDVAAMDGASRIGLYTDRTGGSEKIGVVVMGSEVLSIGVSSLSTANPFTSSNVKQGSGSPNGSVNGVVGDIYQNLAGSSTTTLWVKESGTGNTGWTPVGASGTGTVTSVALTLPGIFSVSGSPVTSNGTLSATLVNQNANLVWAGPASGGAAAPSFRSLVTADLPVTAVTAGSYGSASSVGTFTVDATGRLTAAATVSISILASQVSNFDAQVRTSRLDQMAAPTSAVSFNSQNITGLADPVNPQDAATKNYVDSVAQGLNVKAAVLVASTANLTLSGEQTIDGVLTSASRVLVKNQTTTSQNGIYVTGSGAWTRSVDQSTGAEFPAAFVFVEEGTSQADTGWVCTTDPPVTVGTTAILWSQFSGAGTYLAGAGLTLTGSTFAVNVDNSTIEINANALRVKAGGITSTQLNTTGVSGASYGSASAVGTFTVGTDGRLTAASSTSISIAASQITSGQLSAVRGGTGFDGSAAANGALPIGNGTGFTLATLTAGTGITITNVSGTITITASTGTVTSVALALPSIFNVSGSPVTSSGTLTATLATQNANLVWAGPASGGAAAPTFRALVTADLPTTAVTPGSYGSASSVATFTVDATGRLTAAASTSIAIAASQITSGVLANVRGGTGIDTSTAANGTLLIGNGSGFTLATLAAGNGVAITNAAGSVTVALNETATALSSGANTVDSAAIATFGSVIWEIELVKGSVRYVSTIRSTHDGSSPFYGEYGLFLTGGTTDFTTSVTLSGGNLNLVVTTSSTGWAIRFHRRTLAA